VQNPAYTFLYHRLEYWGRGGGSKLNMNFIIVELMGGGAMQYPFYINFKLG
jgi:hypothetical protein